MRTAKISYIYQLYHVPFLIPHYSCDIWAEWQAQIMRSWSLKQISGQKMALKGGKREQNLSERLS
jgi:hypothetical protein